MGADPYRREGTVLVVGAGPVGLTMACELRRHGVDCRVIDASDGPTPPNQSRALAVHSRTLEMLDLMGLADTAVARGKVIQALNAYRHGQHLARIELDFTGLETPYPFILSLSQGATERLLLERLVARGGAVEWRTRLASLRADDQGVTVRGINPEGAKTESRCGWLIGCDGAHSVVRHQLGLAFEGSAYPERFLLADAPMSWDLDDHEGHVFLLPGGPVASLPLPEPGHWRLIDLHGEGVADATGAVAGRIRDDLARAGVPPATMGEPAWASAFGVHRRAVEQMRVGRVFLAGDAAHIHSPAGGQGMNTGMQDAVNLAWKLALVVRGCAEESVLDSYQAERHPVALEVLRFTDRFTRFATLHNAAARAVRAAALSWLAGTGAVRRTMARALSELTVSYPDSPIIGASEANDSWGGPKPGERLPDLPYGNGRLYSLLRPGRHVVLAFDSGPVPLEPCQEIIDIHYPGAGEAHLRKLLDVKAPCLYLIRPDGYVADRYRAPEAMRIQDYGEAIGLHPSDG